MKFYRSYFIRYNLNLICFKTLFAFILRMALKLSKAPTIWRFLSGLRDYVIEPAKTDVYQLRNGKTIRKPSKVSSLQARRLIESQEQKLRNNLITPMQFVAFMSHHFKKVDLTEDDELNEIDRLTEVFEIEHEWDGEEEEEDVEDEVFDG
jgi:hypothetical protein